MILQFPNPLLVISLLSGKLVSILIMNTLGLSLSLLNLVVEGLNLSILPVKFILQPIHLSV